MLGAGAGSIRTRVIAVAALVTLLAFAAFAPYAGSYTRALALFADAVVRLPVRPVVG